MIDTLIMTEIPRSTPENSSIKTPYETINDLYSRLDVPTKVIQLDNREEKVLKFADGSFISVLKTQSVQKNPWFEVNINGSSFRVSSEESIPDGLLELATIPVDMQISGFVTRRLLVADVVFIPPEQREKVAGILTNWTAESIKEGKITKPPYQINPVS